MGTVFVWIGWDGLTIGIGVSTDWASYSRHIEQVE